jgi:hypothetical protein
MERDKCKEKDEKEDEHKQMECCAFTPVRNRKSVERCTVP